jgi:hypothetical protein
MLNLHAKGLIAQVRADHVRRRIKLPEHWFRRTVCALDGQRWPCRAITIASDIEAGRRDISGRPIGEPL